MKYLCHYTNEKSAEIIISTMALRFGKISESNDPIEMKRFSSCGMDPDLSADDKERNRVSNQLMEYLNKILQVICFSEGTIKNAKFGAFVYGESFEIDLEDGLIHPGNIHNFWERPPYYLPRMWAQYGDNHKGACLIFDKNKLINQIVEQTRDLYNISHKAVIYKDIILDMEYRYSYTDRFYKYYTPDTGGIVDFVQNYIKNGSDLTYFSKDIDWASEKEYRFLIWNKIQNENYHNKEIKIDNESLIGVMSGIHSEGDRLRDISLSQNIKNIMKLTYDDPLIIIDNLKK